MAGFYRTLQRGETKLGVVSQPGETSARSPDRYSIGRLPCRSHLRV